MSKEIYYVACHEDDKDCCGSYTSNDGQSLCYVKEVNLPTPESCKAKETGAGEPIPMQYQLCPKCNGQGTVSKPPYVAGDVNHWVSSVTSFPCDVCNGQKVLPIYSQPSSLPAGEGVDVEALAIAFVKDLHTSGTGELTIDRIKQAFISGYTAKSLPATTGVSDDIQPCSVCGAAMKEIQTHTYNQSAKYECPKCGKVDIFP